MTTILDVKMPISRFWQIVERVNTMSAGNVTKKCELLMTELETLNDRDLIDFTYHFDVFFERAYTWNVLAALYLMVGCSSEGLLSDFRGVLISLGKDVYERAIVDPDSMADIEYENFDDICYQEYRSVRHDVQYERFQDIEPNDVERVLELIGDKWEQDEVKAMYPRLAAKYPDDMFD